ncbi:30866_t:CDS:1 [Racocetra persica]|uniref:30866_t:CDS:1 n=1 Tax=Racocetra persica TaxID=160502 RepID=A0ACA9LEL5_9GLOM|nr:30866_t:CDS:1 [Racocetra persica]
MNNGKSLSLEIPNFLEEENSPATRKIKRLEKEVLAKQKEINFHSKQATNYCERLQSLEVELKDKDQQISGLKSVIQQLKEETSKLLTEKDQQISVLTRELQDSRLVSDLLETDNT